MSVPAVCDGFAVAIKERGAFQQPQNCGGAKHYKGRSPTGVLRNPSRRKAAKRIQTCYVPFFDFLCLLLLINFFIYLTIKNINNIPEKLKKRINAPFIIP